MKDDFGPISVHCEYVHLDVTDKVSFLLKYSFCLITILRHFCLKKQYQY